MKRVLLLCSLVVLTLCGFGQGKHLIRHHNYFVLFSGYNNTPVYGAFKLNKHSFTGSVPIDRTKYHFKADPLYPGSNFAADYAGSRFDRGHMMSAANNTFDAFGMKECFYYTNITPQTPELNRGLWKTLESKERELAKSGQEVTVVFGNTGFQSLIGVSHDITVPEYCWKVIIAADAVRHIADTLAYLIPDSLGLEKDLEKYKISCQQLEQRTGYALKDILALQELKTPKAQMDYMISRIERRFKIDFPSKLPIKDSVLKQFEKKYQDNDAFKAGFKDASVRLPENADRNQFISSSFEASKTQINKAADQYLDQLRSKGSVDAVVNAFYNLNTVRSVLDGAGICPCCGLPLTFPICGCSVFR
jgi:DNA/RNA endonuclease G (NUC1)